jgi:hypothetical protein
MCVTRHPNPIVSDDMHTLLSVYADFLFYMIKYSFFHFPSPFRRAICHSAEWDKLNWTRESTGNDTTAAR